MWAPLRRRARPHRRRGARRSRASGTRRPPAGPPPRRRTPAWLEAQLDAIGEPVDLVAHDWGAILAQRVASLRPDLIRTLACGSGPLDETYTWHAMAQAWQTPEVGEQIVEGMLAMPRADLVAGPRGRWRTAGARRGPGRARSTRRWRAASWRSTARRSPSAPSGSPPSTRCRRVRAVVFHGADDPYVRAESSPSGSRRASTRRSWSTPTAAHWWPWERAPRWRRSLTELWG